MTQITTETLAATAPAGIVVTEYRGYQLIDNENYVTICRNAAVVQCAHTPEQARENIDEIIAEREARKARNAKNMGRHENNPNDLV